jgi:hypothetical protein
MCDLITLVTNHASDIVPRSNSTGFCYQNEKCKSTSPSAIQLKNWQKTISTEEKLDVISRFEKGEHIADIRRMRLISI